MSLFIGDFAIWRSTEDAKKLGATHKARLWGIVPGFVDYDSEPLLWAPRTDLLNWLEDVLDVINASLAELADEDHVTAFRILDPI